MCREGRARRSAAESRTLATLRRHEAWDIFGDTENASKNREIGTERGAGTKSTSRAGSAEPGARAEFTESPRHPSPERSSQQLRAAAAYITPPPGRGPRTGRRPTPLPLPASGFPRRSAETGPARPEGRWGGKEDSAGERAKPRLHAPPGAGVNRRSSPHPAAMGEGQGTRNPRDLQVTARSGGGGGMAVPAERSPPPRRSAASTARPRRSAAKFALLSPTRRFAAAGGPEPCC